MIWGTRTLAGRGSKILFPCGGTALCSCYMPGRMPSLVGMSFSARPSGLLRVTMTVKLLGKSFSLFVGNGLFFLAVKSSVSKQTAYLLC
jgi:hypothetical protein